LDLNELYLLRHIDSLEGGTHEAIIIAVEHNEFEAMQASNIKALEKLVHVLYDLKYI
jgi:hypothetical protein